MNRSGYVYVRVTALFVLQRELDRLRRAGEDRLADLNADLQAAKRERDGITAQLIEAQNRLGCVEERMKQHHMQVSALQDHNNRLVMRISALDQQIEQLTHLAKTESSGDQRLHQLEVLCEKLMSDEKIITNEIDNLSHAYNELQQENMQLRQQLSDKDDAYNKLLTEKLKFENLRNAFELEKSQIDDRLRRMNSLLDQKEQHIYSLEAEMKVQEARLVRKLP